MKIRLFVLIMLVSFSSLSFAKRFSNNYIEFELPPGWNCMMEGTEWVCQSDDKDRKREAIIIMAAKRRGKQDTLAEYQAYLKQAKTYSIPGGKMQKSEPKSVKNNSINGQEWVDALHLASEVPGFYTRYLASVKGDIGVAITFSVTKSLYTAYKGVFDNIIASMRIFVSDKVNISQGNGKGVGSDGYADTSFIPSDAGINIAASKVKKRKGEDGDSSNLIILLLILGVVGFIIFKLKKKK